MLTLRQPLGLGLGGPQGKGAPPPANLLQGLSWQAGPSTTLSIASGRARATTTNAGVNPRIYKGPFNVVSGGVYVMAGHGWKGLSTSYYIRISRTSGVAADGEVNNNYSADQDLTGLSWTSTVTGVAYFGLIPLVVTLGDYGEVDDAMSIIRTS